MKKKVVSVLFVLIIIMLVLTGCKKANENETQKENKTNEKTTTAENKEYQEAIEKYFKGLNECNAKAYASAYPDFEKKAESVKDKSLYERKKNLEKVYGENLAYSYEILRDKEMKKSELEDVEDYIEEKFRENVKIKKGYKVKTRQKVSGDDDFDDATDYIYVYNIDGKWYIMGVSPDDVRD